MKVVGACHRCLRAPDHGGLAAFISPGVGAADPQTSHLLIKRGHTALLQGNDACACFGFAHPAPRGNCRGALSEIQAWKAAFGAFCSIWRWGLENRCLGRGHRGSWPGGPHCQQQVPSVHSAVGKTSCLVLENSVVVIDYSCRVRERESPQPGGELLHLFHPLPMQIPPIGICLICLFLSNT